MAFDVIPITHALDRVEFLASENPFEITLVLKTQNQAFGFRMTSGDARELSARLLREADRISQ